MYNIVRLSATAKEFWKEKDNRIIIFPKPLELDTHPPKIKKKVLWSNESLDDDDDDDDEASYCYNNINYWRRMQEKLLTIFSEELRFRLYCSSTSMLSWLQSHSLSYGHGFLANSIFYVCTCWVENFIARFHCSSAATLLLFLWRNCSSSISFYENFKSYWAATLCQSPTWLKITVVKN